MRERSSRRGMTVFYHEDMLWYRIPDAVLEAPPEGSERILNTRAILQRCDFGLLELLRAPGCHSMSASELWQHFRLPYFQ